MAKFPIIAGAFCNVQAAVCQFTDVYMDTIFNPANPNQSGIDYRFIGGSKNPFPWGWLLRPLQGDNDGIIGKYSAVGWDYPLKIGSIEGSRPGRYWSNETHTNSLGYPSYFDAWGC